jgi:hypothetical protein
VDVASVAIGAVERALAWARDTAGRSRPALEDGAGASR